MSNNTHPLTNEQLADLKRYISIHGRTWKAALREEWMKGHDKHGRSIGASLQILRNTHGPAWLKQFKLSK